MRLTSENAMPTTPSPPATDPLVFLRLPEVERRVGFKRATIYRVLADPSSDFPRPVKLGLMSAWPEHEINAWLAKKLAERDARVAA